MVTTTDNKVFLKYKDVLQLIDVPQWPEEFFDARLMNA